MLQTLNLILFHSRFKQLYRVDYMGGQNSVGKDSQQSAASQSGRANIFDSIYQPATVQVSSEVTEYLQSPLEPKSMKPLVFWHANMTRYPTLAKMSRDYLAIPASSVPCECVFSKSTHLINKKRNNLASSTTRAVMCLNSWAKFLWCDQCLWEWISIKFILF